MVKKEDIITNIIIKGIIEKIGSLEIEVVKVATLKFLGKKKYTVLNKTITHHIKSFINRGANLKVIKL